MPRAELEGETWKRGAEGSLVMPTVQLLMKTSLTSQSFEEMMGFGTC